MSFLHGLEQAGFITILFLMSLYFLPAIVAKMRHKQNVGAIFALNLLAGWTFIGWVGALVWAMTTEAPGPQPTTVVEKREVW